MARHFDGETSGEKVAGGSCRVAIVAGAVLGVAAVVAVAAWFVVKGSAKTEQTNDAQVSEVATAADKAAWESAGGAAAISGSDIDTSATATEAVTITSASTSTTQTTSSLAPLSIDNDVPADGESTSDSGTSADTTPSNESQVNNGTAATGLAAGAPDNDVVVE